MLESCEKFVGPSKTAMALRRPVEAKDFPLMKRAVSNVITWFGLNDLHQYQEDALIGILDSRDVFVAHPTGTGESVVYHQLAPFACDIYNALVGSQDSVAKEKVKFKSQGWLSNHLFPLPPPFTRVLRTAFSLRSIAATEFK